MNSKQSSTGKSVATAYADFLTAMNRYQVAIAAAEREVLCVSDQAKTIVDRAVATPEVR